MFKQLKRFWIVVFVMIWIAGALFVQPSTTQASGVSSHDWDSLHRALRNNLIPGEWTYDNCQDCQKAVTREEMSTIAVLLYERWTGKKASVPSAKPFKDTKNSYVLKAYSLGIMGGTSGQAFSPKQLITREDQAVILYKTMQKSGIADMLKTGPAVKFADANTIASWARPAVDKLAAAGLLKGTETKSGLLFRPKDKVTRVQLSLFSIQVDDTYGAVYLYMEKDLFDSSSFKGRALIFKDSRTEKIYEEVIRIFGKILKPGMSDMEKEIAIHDYIVLNTVYDHDNYMKNKVPVDSYSAYGVLFKGTAVCEGYANTTQIMLSIAGIESYVVTGFSNRNNLHAWNKVKIGGDYYNLDVTWDDPAPDVKGGVRYNYFNVTDEELSKDHWGWQYNEEFAKENPWYKDMPGVNLPAATATTYNYYKYKERQH